MLKTLSPGLNCKIIKFKLAVDSTVLRHDMICCNWVLFRSLNCCAVCQITATSVKGD